MHGALVLAVFDYCGVPIHGILTLLAVWKGIMACRLLVRETLSLDLLHDCVGEWLKDFFGWLCKFKLYVDEFTWKIDGSSTMAMFLVLL